MPHAVIEYSGNIEETVLETDLTSVVWGVMDDSGLFTSPDIKVRSIDYSDFMVGEKGQDGSFVHVGVSILSGRTEDQKTTLSTQILNAIKKYLEGVDQISVEIRDIDRTTYRKA